MEKILTIAGGGPAGLACGIRLQQLGWDVTVHERGHYPLKKVCGEFLSPQAWTRFCRLGGEWHLPLPPRPLRRARFYSDDHGYAELELSPQALGLRREVLDTALAARFRELGGKLLEGSDWQPQSGPNRVVDARGRGAGPRDGPWMAWKGSLAAQDAPAELAAADLLMLPLPQGYVGLCWVDDGSVSVCLIARRGWAVPDLLQAHPVLAAVASKLKAHAAIAGFHLSEVPGADRLGDRRRVWPPVVGDGIHRALASGEAKALEIAGLPGEGRDLTTVQFAMARTLHKGMLYPWMRRGGLSLLKAWPAIGKKAYQWTRS